MTIYLSKVLHLSVPRWILIIDGRNQISGAAVPSNCGCNKLTSFALVLNTKTRISKGVRVRSIRLKSKELLPHPSREIRDLRQKPLQKADCDKKIKSHRALSLILQFTSKNLIWDRMKSIIITTANKYRFFMAGNVPRPLNTWFIAAIVVSTH